MTKTNFIAVDFDPFENGIIESVVPATESQKEIWLSCIIGGHNANLAYNQSLGLQLNGNLDEKKLIESLLKVISRHESLRSSFSADGGSMFINQYSEANISQQDISSHSAEKQKEIIDTFLKNDAEAEFDLTNGPLYRITLFRQTPTKFFLNFCAHHIICDGWSFGVLFEDICAVYNALCNNTALPPHPDKYSTYAIEENIFSNTEECADNEAYWVNKFKTAKPGFEISPDFIRPKERTYQARRDDFILSRADAEKIKRTGAGLRCSFATTLLAAFEIFIYKLTGNKEIILGLPTAGQSATGIFNLIGHCVNMLPIKTTVDGSESFSEYLKKRKSETLEDYSHQRFTFGTLLKKINFPRDAARVPLIPVSFNIDIGMDTNVSFKDVEHRITYSPGVSETFELFLNIADVKEGYEFQWSYNTALYKKATVKSWMDNLVYLFEQISEDSGRSIDCYKLKEKTPEEQIVNNRNTTATLLPKGTTISLFESAVKNFSDKNAVQFGPKTKTYTQLNEDANRLAHYLRQQGLKKGEMVGIAMNRNKRLPASLLAVLKCGAAYVPLDPDFPEERINFMLEDSGAAFIVMNKEYSGKFNSSAREIILENIDSELVQMPASNLHTLISDDDIAYVIYTSGSTGQPKAVMITHHNLLNFIVAMKEMFNTDEHLRLLAVTTISFDIAGLEIFLPLTSGGTLIIAASETTKDGEILLKEIIDNNVTMLQATPATYKMLIDAGWHKKLSITALCGGEALPKSLAQKLTPLVEELYNMYGPTETTIWSTVAKINIDADVISVGHPIANTQIYIVNENGQLVVNGEVGEIWIGGDGVAKGYHNRDELTAEKFITPSFQIKQPGKVYKTGDLGKILPNGEILCLGRIDQQAKIRGFRIELEEIEHKLEKLPGIKEAVCVIKGDDDDQKLIAFVLTESDLQILSKQLLMQWRADLRKSLPQYMIPSEFIKLNEFPLTPNKKIDRKTLQQYSKAKVSQTKNSPEEQSRNKEIIKKLWIKELGINDIEEDDDFFDLGGHSMTAVKVMSAIAKETGVKLPIASLFENPTLRSLTAAIAGVDNFNAEKVVIPLQPRGTKTPVFLIHAAALNILMYKPLIPYLNENQPVYGIQGLGLNGDISDIESIETIAARYLSEVRTQQPNGPYKIIGYSFGGIVGYEMARQLINNGEKVQVLGMLDTYVHEPASNGKMRTLGQKITRQLRKSIFFGKSFVLNPVKTFNYQKLILNRKFNKNFVDADEEQIYDYSPEVIHAYDKASDNYVMQPLDISVDLFKVQERIYYLDDPRYLGWKNYALKGVSIHSIPGDHKTFLTFPNIEKMGAIMQKVLDKN